MEKKEFNKENIVIFMYVLHCIYIPIQDFEFVAYPLIHNFN